jgi:hypothetical protein
MQKLLNLDFLFVVCFNLLIIFLVVAGLPSSLSMKLLGNPYVTLSLIFRKKTDIELHIIFVSHYIKRPGSDYPFNLRVISKHNRDFIPQEVRKL